MCGLALKKKKNAEISELLALEPVSLVIENGRLSQPGHVERENDADYVKRCTIDAHLLANI